jgi:hypothetical protein
VIKVQSESEPGKVYEVNLTDHTCNCLHHTRKLHRLAASDPRRLCKHLVAAMADFNAFGGFEKFREEILWLAKYNSGYSSKGKALNKKLRPHRKTPKEPLPPGSIQTAMHELTKQPEIGDTPFYLWCDPDVYHYIKGKAREDTVEAIIPEQGGIGLYSINEHPACEYYFGEPKSEEVAIGGVSDGMTIVVRFETGPVPIKYKYLQEALFFWLEEEFGRQQLGKGDRP